MIPPIIAMTVSVQDSEIGIPRAVVEVGYWRAAEVAGALPLILSTLIDPETVESMLDRSSGLMLTGGEDVSPSRYGQEPNGARTVSPERDELELRAVRRALETGLPILAICRGTQLLNVALGGTLYQDLGTQWHSDIDHDRYREFDSAVHGVRVEGERHATGVFTDREFKQNSAHHQGIHDLAPTLIPIAWAEDGLIEGVECHGDGCGWVVGVQWHPERKIDGRTGTNRRLFERFGGEVRRFEERRR
jgi:putative glutamine amidotransferase